MQGRTNAKIRVTAFLLLGATLSLALSAGAAWGGPIDLSGPDKYAKLDIVSVVVSAPRPASCYDSRVGHYPCIGFGVTLVVLDSQGKQGSLSFEQRVDGTYLDTVQQEFGRNAPKYFEALKKAWVLSPLESPGDLSLTPEVAAKLDAFIASINEFEAGLDLAGRPADLYYQQSLRALYEVTEAFLRAGSATAAEQDQAVEANHNTAKALIEISKTGLDVSASLIPFVNDARDVYELVTGRDLLTGEEIDGFGRLLTGVALVAGNGNVYRKAAGKLKDSFAKKAIKKAEPGIPGLTYKGGGAWESAEGLIYRRAVGEKKENRLRHVLRHATPDPAKPSHTVFSGEPWDVPKLIDQAWKKRGSPLPDDPGAYVVDMGKVVGKNGEKKIRVVVEPGTSNIVTAYPEK